MAIEDATDSTEVFTLLHGFRADADGNLTPGTIAAEVFCGPSQSFRIDATDSFAAALTDPLKLAEGAPAATFGEAHRATLHRALDAWIDRKIGAAV